MRLGIVAHRATDTNIALAVSAPYGVDAFVVTPEAALADLGPGDVALGRLDVRTSVDGIEDGLWQLDLLAARGVRVLNSSQTLRLAHDKLLTSTALGAAQLPHPLTVSVRSLSEAPPLPYPFVVKPRFGSWGRDVTLVRDASEWEATCHLLSERPWFVRCGAIAQELVPPLGHDLRIVVAGTQIIGAIKRVAAPGEWRTNVALGATREATVPPPVARELALETARVFGRGLVGVDLLPLGPGRYIVIEVNGAVDFTPQYAPLVDVYACTVEALLEREPLAATA